MAEGSVSFSNLFEELEFGAVSPDDLFSILETLETAPDFDSLISLDETTSSTIPPQECETKAAAAAEAEAETSHARKRQKLSKPSTEEAVTSNPDGQQRMSHITVERNRRKHMNDHITVLRSLVPCFYVKRGDQASIIGGVVDYIKELQQILRSLEAKKQRKVYSEVLSPRLQVSGSPRPSPLSPRKPQPSPLSPRTPQPANPYLPKMQQGYNLSSATMASTMHEASYSSSLDNVKELAGSSKSTIAEVEVKFSGPNVLLKTISVRIPGQAVKIVAALEKLALEILHVSISTVDGTMLNSFTIKIGIECELSAEELANEIQQTFC